MGLSCGPRCIDGHAKAAVCENGPTQEGGVGFREHQCCSVVDEAAVHKKNGGGCARGGGGGWWW